MNETLDLKLEHLEYIIKKVRNHMTYMHGEDIASSYHPVHIQKINDEQDDIIEVFFISEIGDNVTWYIRMQDDDIVSDGGGTIG